MSRRPQNLQDLWPAQQVEAGKTAAVAIAAGLTAVLGAQYRPATVDFASRRLDGQPMGAHNWLWTEVFLADHRCRMQRITPHRISIHDPYEPGSTMSLGQYKQYIAQGVIEPHKQNQSAADLTADRERHQELAQVYRAERNRAYTERTSVSITHSRLKTLLGKPWSAFGIMYRDYGQTRVYELLLRDPFSSNDALLICKPDVPGVTSGSSIIEAPFNRELKRHLNAKSDLLVVSPL